MKTEEKIGRINHLSRKSKAEGLTAAEKQEQSLLRSEYLCKFRENFKGHLERIRFVDSPKKDEQKK